MGTRVFDTQHGTQGRPPPGQARRQPAPRRSSTAPVPRHACACGGTCPRCAARITAEPAVPVQRKSAVSVAGDAGEREADAVADRVMRMDAAPGPAPAVSGTHAPAIQAKPGPPDSAMPDTGGALRAAAQAGRALDDGQRAFFEPRFGRDFSQVRIHTDGAAARAAAGIQARAYTVGRDIVFGQGEYASTPGGRRLLAHELTHVAQQAAPGLAPRIQRQPKEAGEGELASQDQVPPSSGQAQFEPRLVDIPGATEPGKCPAKGKLGDIAPDPPCELASEPVDGDVILFCPDSDAFLDQAEADKLRTLGRTQPHGTEFRLQAHASTEGPGGAAQARKYNENLACHRGKRAAHVLMDVGVPESDIQMTSGGPTDRFGKDAKLRHLNRNVVVGAIKPGAAAPTGPVTGGMRGIADAAKKRLVDGDYNIGADGYLYRWTCGRWNSLAEAVARTNVRVSGEPGFVNNKEGVAALGGINNIDLPDEILLEFGNEVECAMARIADLTFHHFARPLLPIFSELHGAGAHLVALAGLAGCQTIGAGKPRPLDPFAGKQPDCARTVDTGALDTKTLPGGSAPAFFGVIQPDPPFTASGGFVFSGSSAQNTVNADPDHTPMLYTATVTTSGKAKEAGAFEVGFVQTALEDENVSTYVGGQKVFRELPLPLRDGAPSGDPNHIDAPWFMQGARAQAVPGNASVSMIDEPNATSFARFPNLARTSFAMPGPHKTELVTPPFHTQQVANPKDPKKPKTVMFQGFAEDKPNDIIDRIDRKLAFVTWLVARRRGAALARDSTQFLSGIRTELELHPSFVARPKAWGALDFGGSGGWTLKATPATQADIGEVRLSGAVPGEFATRFILGPGGTPLFTEFLRSDEKVPGRDKNNGLHANAWRAEVQRIVNARRKGKPALLVPMLVTVKVDLATGRVALDDPATLAGGAVAVKQIAGQTLTPAQARQLAIEVFPDVRKLVLGFIPNAQGRDNGMIEMAVTLSADVTP
ncbi:MAG: DUF4157 domain-containing protein [Pseudomonadota bacterium]